MNRENIFEALENDVINTELNEETKKIIIRNIKHLQKQKLNIMITGATGSGKSSTINALFNMEVAKVGVGVNPETMDIEKYELDNMTIWDTPGLGDGKEADNRHAKNIINKLVEVDEYGNALIDLVLVVLDGSSRDLGTSYELINNVIIPNLGPEKEKRILIAINQADMAMKGRNWDYEKNEPNEVLKAFLEEKAESVKRRIKDATGVETNPIYYSAGYKEADELQCKPYNLSKLLYYIVLSTPLDKRSVYIGNTNKDKRMWEDGESGEGIIDYGNETRKNILESIIDGARKGAEIGGEIGAIFGPIGEKLCKGLGVVFGVAGGVIKGICSLFSW